MNAPAYDFSPGVLVKARGREWVVQPDTRREALRLRPFGGSDEDVVTLIPELELTPPEPASFAWPDPERPGTHDAARLLRDALKLKLRAGAGPFRSFGNIAVEPRAYQLVPLLMALRLPTIRLLVADDVGIGKTIEAGLIARELLDRGEISRLAVLCPPHLVEQWQQELAERFHMKAVALTSASVAKIERDLPHGISLFDQHPFVVVSLDYIKSERHREHFLAIAPECIIVDEAHTCAAAGQGRQLRFELLQRLGADESRHLILLTATPHSGDESAFYNLLTLLKTEFGTLQGIGANADHPLRRELARHFVQRRRKDIEEWQDTRIFPRRMTAEVTYTLSGRWGHFFDSVQDYCIDMADRAEQTAGGSARLIWYATLALLRCVASSPAAAEKALSTRLTGTLEEMEALADEERMYDGQPDNLSTDDLEPPARLEEAEYLTELIEEARSLAGSRDDPKLAALIEHLDVLLRDGFHPVVFCRYVATAHYVAAHVRRHFPNATVDAVTGEYTPGEREVRVANLGETEQPVLIATDCMSEGINLQHHFDAVVHYDLAWNPTRHEQREGRVDRFGQQSSKVRATMLYGQDNPVDGFILNVILRKAEAIRKELGVLVPMPEDEQRISQALIKAALLKRNRTHTAKQEAFDFGDPAFDLKPVEIAWQDALERAKANRTVFAQRRLRPEEVLPEWRKQLEVLGGEEDVARFVQGATRRLNAPLETYKRTAFRLLPQHLPQIVRERLAEEGFSKPMAVDFHYPPAAGAQFVHRSHPLVALLADTLLEGAMTDEAPLAARAAATVTTEVDLVTTLYLLRIRHQLSFTRRGEARQLMAEETVAIAVRGRTRPEWLFDTTVAKLLDAAPSANLSREQAAREVQAALDFLEQQRAALDDLAKERAEALLADHRRVRKASDDVGQYAVHACLPVDVLGIYVLLPDAL
jgi:superfamily II DNA or RNA helicase